jgi:hypothetical protein
MAYHVNASPGSKTTTAPRLARICPRLVQRTRFQLRRPSGSEEGVCCKPELGSPIRHRNY